MDRNDEQKPVSSTDPDQDQTQDRREETQAGEILGLGGAVPKEPGDPTTEHDEESVARRRARMAGEDETLASRHDATQRSAGATGIDMGAGGSGTGLSGK